MSMKRKSKKMAATANALAEEHKSDEVKALEACLTAWRGMTHSLWPHGCTTVPTLVGGGDGGVPSSPPALLPAAVDSQEVELTGQEDITLLYGTLATESAVNAHKDGQCNHPFSLPPPHSSNLHFTSYLLHPPFSLLLPPIHLLPPPFFIPLPTNLYLPLQFTLCLISPPPPPLLLPFSPPLLSSSPSSPPLLLPPPLLPSLPSSPPPSPVHKFRRRPRYLEFFVLLCCKALEEGHYSSVVAWSEEALSWLRRRNELLVQPKVPMLTRREPATLTGDQARYANAVTKYIEKPKVSDLWDSE